MKVLCLGLLLVTGCAGPSVVSRPVYFPHYSRQQLDDIDWRLRMQELDQGNAEIERMLQHRQLMRRLDEIAP